jgi:hypothetical protein
MAGHGDGGTPADQQVPTRGDTYGVERDFGLRSVSSAESPGQGRTDPSSGGVAGVQIGSGNVHSLL